MSYLIHNTGRERIIEKKTRLVESLSKNWTSNVEFYECKTCHAKNGTTKAMYSATECRECHSNRTTACVCCGDQQVSGAMSLTDTGLKKCPSSQPKFKVGDLVECLPFYKFANGNQPSINSAMMIGEYFRIANITKSRNDLGEVVASLGESYVWPLRALRHAETEPREEDGWKKRANNDSELFSATWGNENGRVYLNRNRTIWGYIPNKCTHSFRDHTSWIDLKREIEERKIKSYTRLTGSLGDYERAVVGTGLMDPACQSDQKTNTENKPCSPMKSS